MHSFIRSFSNLGFLLGRLQGALGSLEALHGFRHPLLTVLLTPNQDATEPHQGCNHSTWPLVVF